MSLKQQQLGKTLWSFPTGSPIHSLYLAPLNAVSNTENATDISSTFLSRYMDYSEPTPLDDQVKIKRLLIISYTFLDISNFIWHIFSLNAESYYGGVAEEDANCNG